MVDGRNGGGEGERGCFKLYREQSLVWKLQDGRIISLQSIITYMASGPSQPPKTVSLVSMFESPAVIVAHLSLLL